MYFRPEIAAMAGYTPGEQPQGASKFIKLNTNENPYPPPPGIRGAIEEVLQRGLQKYPDPMANAFRTRAAELLGLPGKDWILAGNGSDDILTICTRAFVGQGELLRLPYPSYILYRTLAQLQAARWEEARFNPDWSLPAAFGAARTLRGGTALLLRPWVTALPTPRMRDSFTGSETGGRCPGEGKNNKPKRSEGPPEIFLG